MEQEFSQCAFRDKKQLSNAIFLTILFIATISLTVFSTVGTIHITASISVQISVAIALLLTVCILRKILGFFLSFTIFAIPFFVMLLTGSMLGANYESLSMKEQRLIVWEWLLFPVGSSLYFFACLAYWMFRRYRRRYN